MYRCNRFVSPALNLKDFRSFDTFASADYGINACGFIRSDFAELSERNDAVGLAKLLSRFNEISEDNTYQNLSDEEKFSLIRPRSMQTPAELDRFEQYCLDEGIKFMRKLHDSDVAKLSVGSEDSVDGGKSVTDS